MPHGTRRSRALARYVHLPSARTSHRRRAVPCSPGLTCRRVVAAVVDRGRYRAERRGNAHALSMDGAACSSARETIGRGNVCVGAAKFASAARAVGDNFVAAGRVVDVAGAVGRAVVWQRPSSTIAAAARGMPRARMRRRRKARVTLESARRWAGRNIRGGELRRGEAQVTTAR
ncbi:hypothetical protein HYPSUDRAFT_200832 [Hypholoma sublateritium FD-334 SS-4]|uniref:Uncharacterized protein n=1 Tax=Hypholoma sublateritium (strain FD-334 SS-4) TaxID=945553 RepID=A0A0D2NZ69_HYPSF|nr:hypothetical protein HYPSUDRAFT_200832 [Hypholoma sublateritium FD-334 SS-4]